MKLRQFVPLVSFAVMLISGYANAGASNDFKSSCNNTTATIAEGINLTKYNADTNTKHKGIFITDNKGTTRLIPGAELYPDNYIAEEIRKTALAAVMSGMKVNICEKKISKSLTEVWAIELDSQ